MNTQICKVVSYPLFLVEEQLLAEEQQSDDGAPGGLQLTTYKLSSSLYLN